MSFETLFGICSAHLSCGDRRFEISLRPSITKVPCFAQEAVFRLCSASPSGQEGVADYRVALADNTKVAV